MLQIYTVYDKKIQTYMSPSAVPHETVLTRNLTEVANDPASSIAKYPTDFELYLLGTFDQTTGVVTTSKQPQFVMNLSELITQPPKKGAFQEPLK